MSSLLQLDLTISGDDENNLFISDKHASLSVFHVATVKEYRSAIAADLRRSFRNLRVPALVVYLGTVLIISEVSLRLGLTSFP